MTNFPIKLAPDLPGDERLEVETPDTIQRAVFRGTSTGSFAVIVTDHTKTGEPVVYVNKAFEDLTGYKLAEVIGIHPHFLLTSDKDQVGVKAIEAAIRAGQPCSAILRDYRKDSTPVWYQVAISPVFSKTGQVTHFFGYLKDVTATVGAEQADENWETLISSFAHDLNGPLAAGDKLFALITKGAFGDVSPELQATILLLSQSNKRALDLVSNLLESFRLGKGMELMHFEDLDLKVLIEKTVQEVEAMAGLPKGKLEVNITDDLSNCLLDRLSIIRLVANLLDNAIKYSPEDAHVQLSCELVRGKILLKITDHGIGIPSEDRELIFRKGKRGSKNKSAYSPGCGLGLYICKAIVKAHRGQITFDSQPGSHTTFSVVIPHRSSADALRLM